MREIKFRAWDKENEVMREHFTIASEDGECFDREYAEPKWILLQFTGLKDKNGKEIYEGDIVDFAGLKPIEIVWEDSGFQSKMYGSNPIKLTEKGMSMFGEVIGNIYENPELLKEK